MIVGLSGYARVGKDTVADILVKEFGFKKVAFADKLREFLYTLDPVVLWDPNVEPIPYIPSYMPLRWIIDEHGWDGYKDTGWALHIRQYLQRLGTECGRELIDDNIWVNAAFGEGNGQDIVIPDTRFFNEATAIKARKGVVFRVERPGVGPINNHPSETALDRWNFDGIIHNDRDPYALKLEVENKLGRYARAHR